MMEITKTKIILDSDIGDDIDDAFALALAINSPEIELLGVTTVFRNSQKRAKIAKTLAESLKSQVKVYAGIDEPLIQNVKQLIPLNIAKNEKHDEFDKYLPPQYRDKMSQAVVEDIHAVDLIIQMAHRYPHELVLVPVGPLTNIAMAIRKDPSIISKIKKIVIMGGYDENKYPEWNIFCDPEAARIVYTSGANLETVGLDVTLKCTLSETDINELKKSKNQTSELLSEMMESWFEHYQFKVPVMHDPLAVATLIDHYVTFSVKNVLVDLVEKRGSTLEVGTEVLNSSKVKVGISVRNEAFLTMFKERVFRY